MYEFLINKPENERKEKGMKKRSEQAKKTPCDSVSYYFC